MPPPSSRAPSAARPYVDAVFSQPARSSPVARVGCSASFCLATSFKERVHMYALAQVHTCLTKKETAHPQASSRPKWQTRRKGCLSQGNPEQRGPFSVRLEVNGLAAFSFSRSCSTPQIDFRCPDTSFQCQVGTEQASEEHELVVCASPSIPVWLPLISLQTLITNSPLDLFGRRQPAERAKSVATRQVRSLWSSQLSSNTS